MFFCFQHSKTCQSSPGRSFLFSCLYYNTTTGLISSLIELVFAYTFPLRFFALSFLTIPFTNLEYTVTFCRSLTVSVLVIFPKENCLFCSHSLSLSVNIYTYNFIFYSTIYNSNNKQTSCQFLFVHFHRYLFITFCMLCVNAYIEITFY